MSAIRVKNLTKRFDGFTAVDSISLIVEDGEFFGLLGPNGAGKTTTIRMLTGVLQPDDGTASVCGYDIQENPLEAKQLMGIVPEFADAYVDISAMKNLLLMGELYGIPKKESKEKANSLLNLFGLYEKRNQKVKTFSKGMKQRVVVAMGLMNDPSILFLDEPTSGLDVESVRLIRKLIQKINDDGITIVLTTHNIEEANQLCDRVAIMNHGKIVAIDRPEVLRRTIQSTASVEFSFLKTVELKDLAFDNVIEVKKVGDKIRLYTEKPEDLIPCLVKYAESSGNKIVSLNTLAPNLEDVYVKLTEGKKK
ncbi:MAG: ATP-binding cassette domain-containing protein [Deltaproteobacteria bacterium]|uniref:ATP-binding cassette domain-containing protein n=1 Tax=Candidatus Zymogenus saltonus TaxID=2844893 RepID=A0A9D8KGF9_9DELT|nr:ATP-binding cassette domain-containing protein [Candidatus Zymogenus saltonus]